MIIKVDDSKLRDVLSDLIEELDYDVWKELFVAYEDDESFEEEEGRTSRLRDLEDVFRKSLLDHTSRA